MNETNASAGELRGSGEVVTRRLKGDGLVRFPLAIPEQMAADLRVIRDRLFLELEGKERVSAGFASSLAGEGTTTVLLKLALATAQDGGGLVLVDADPQRGLTKLLGMEGRRGFGEWCRGSPPAEVVHETEVRGLGVIPAGDIGDAQRSTIDWGRLLSGLRERARVVFVDLPPILSSTAASRFSAVGDGLVLVVAAHRTRREVLHRAVSELKRQTGATLLGTVLNGREYFIPGFLYKRV